MMKKRPLTPKKLCKHLRILYNCGFCTKFRCICYGYECEYRDICGICFEECRSQEITPLPDAHVYYDEAVMKLSNLITKETERIPETEFFGGMLWLREDNVLHALTDGPGDITTACQANNFLEDISWLSQSDVKPSKRILHLNNLVVFRQTCEWTSLMLRNQDLMLLPSQEGIRELSILRRDPVKHMRDTMNRMEKIMTEKARPQSRGEIRPYFTEKMLPAYAWCKANSYPVDFNSLTQSEELKAIREHMEEVGKTHKINPRICYSLSYPVYMNLVYLCRYLYSHVESVKATVRICKNKFKLFRREIGSNLNILFWDSMVSTCDARLWSGNYFIRNGPMIKKLPWPIQSSDGFTFGSMLLIGFMLRNWRDVMMKPYEKGRYFEKRLSDELTYRTVNMLERNFDTPKGEVDFLCEKNSRYYVIEAKDYGPWYGQWYMDSGLFSERLMKMNERLVNARVRLSWLEEHKNRFSIPEDAPLKGLIITRFREDFINVPRGMKYISLSKIDEVFGKLQYPL